MSFIDTLPPSQRVLYVNWRRLGHLPPLGWNIDRRREAFIPDPVYFPVIRQIWDLVLDGIPVDQVLRAVNGEWRFRTPIRGRTGGKPLARSALYKLLRDPFYCGRVMWGEHEAPGQHGPMVTEEEFAKIQKALDGRRRHHRERAGATCEPATVCLSPQGSPDRLCPCDSVVSAHMPKNS